MGENMVPGSSAATEPHRIRGHWPHLPLVGREVVNVTRGNLQQWEDCVIGNPTLAL